MSTDTLEMLKSLDSSLMLDPVRQDQRSPAFEILDWTVEPISHEKIIDTTGGLYCFSGHGQDERGESSWAIVLKIVNKPSNTAEDIRNVFYWKRELLAFQSGVLAKLPGGFRAPRGYGVTERDDGGWIWMEHMVESTERRWSLEHFQRAAYRAGHFGAAYLTGMSLPDYSWLSYPLIRGLFTDGEWWADYMDPESASNAWQSPHIQLAFPDPMRSRIMTILAEKERFFEALDRLPQVFCHNDLFRRNLMIVTSSDGQEELVALDWAMCGNGAVGSDAGVLIADSTIFYESEPSCLSELEETVLESYQRGLYDAGWQGDERLVRLGYLLTIALWHGVSLPGWAAVMLQENSWFDPMAMCGRPAEEVLAGWVKLDEFLLDRADEARSLMRTLNLD